MKIWLSGAHATGKSHLVRHISKQYNLPMIFETARTILSEMELKIDALRCDLDTSDKYQQQVFNRQLLEEQKYPTFVSDRSAIDVLAYTATHTRILRKLMASSELTTYIDGLLAPGSIVFILSPSPDTLRADGVREALNWDSIVSIHSKIRLLYDMYGVRYFQIDTSNMSERAKLVDNVLSLIK